MTAQRKIVVVNHDSMMNEPLFRQMHFAPKNKLAAYRESIEAIAMERKIFESGVERRLADGSYVRGQSADIKHLDALVKSDAVARLFCALKIDPRSALYPQSQGGGKSDNETSNLKALKKVREIAETIWNGKSDLENVVKVSSVCAYKMTTTGMEVINRKYAEDFLASREYRSISQGSEDFLSAVEEVDALRARHMSTGAATQTSQMIRTLVALKSAKDVRNGRSKDVAIDPNGLVINALMRRFGQKVDVVEHDDVTEEALSDALVSLEPVAEDDNWMQSFSAEEEDLRWADADDSVYEWKDGNQQ